jgi:RNA polymerase sigma-70 factor (ECF subfamily)
MSEHDSQLVEQCRAGQPSAFEELYRAHSRRLKAYFCRCGFNHADADDLLHDAFARAWGSLATFDSQRGQFGAWLAAIARNVARRQANRRGDARDFDPQLAEHTLVATDNPGLSAQEAEELIALRECISFLPDEPSRLVRMRYIEALTTRGIAQATGTPEATVRLRLSEAMAALERCLNSKGVLK